MRKILPLALLAFLSYCSLTQSTQKPTAADDPFFQEKAVEDEVLVVIGNENVFISLTNISQVSFLLLTVLVHKLLQNLALLANWICLLPGLRAAGGGLGPHVPMGKSQESTCR